MAQLPDAVVLVTDFGTDDAYAGALIGACWRVDRRVRCVTGTHGVPPGDVLAGAYQLKALVRAFPAGTVFCAVVDPGVGTGRRAIAVEAAGVRCVAPDNGLVSYLWAESAERTRRCVALTVPQDASTTFHGRDVFAPVAARLAAGADLDDCGDAAGTPTILDRAFARPDGDELIGVVAVVDRFGNAITTVRTCDLDGRAVVEARWEGGVTQRVARTYADVGDGLAVVVGSAEHLEIAASSKPAAALGGPERGSSVHVRVRAR